MLLTAIAPKQVHDLFVRENGVSERAAARHQQDQEKYQRTDSQKAPTPGNGA